MGALLAFAGPGAPPPEPWARARRWLEEGKGLPVLGEAEGVVKYGRVHGGASPLATDDAGWLAVAGTWVHSDVATDDTPALLGRDWEGLDGVWAAVRREQGVCTATTDPFGRLHLFVAEAPEGCYLSTSAIALAAIVGAEPDPHAVYEFLASGVLYEDRTPFTGVRRLAAGRAYRFEDGRLAGTTEPRLLPTGRDADLAPGALADAVIAAYRPLLAQALAPYPNALPDLTGGVDSRLVLGLLDGIGVRCDVTVTGADADPDVVVARRLADALGLSLRHVSSAQVDGVKADFEKVRRGAALAECGCDAVQYGWIGDLHATHAGLYAASVNGSGGEMFRNYWWGGSTCMRTDLDAEGPGLRRFAGLSIDPSILAADHRRDARGHFADVMRRSLAPRAGEPFHVLMDHLYVDLRMQCWQGGMASASNQIWPVLSPLFWEAPLRVIFAADPRRRLGGLLAAELMRRFPPVYRRLALDSGFPPDRLSAANFWRFLPGVARLPGRYWPRVRHRLFPRPPPVGPGAAIVRALMASGAGDFLAPDRMALAPLLDGAAYAAFHARAGASGEVPLDLLGRVLSLEFAYREASSR